MPEDLGKIQPTEVDWLKDKELKLDFLIGQMGELKARVDSLKNPSLTAESLYTMVDSWNQGHPALTGMYAERVFNGPRGMKLKIRMDQKGSIQLAAENK